MSHQPKNTITLPAKEAHFKRRYTMAGAALLVALVAGLHLYFARYKNGLLPGALLWPDGIMIAVVGALFLSLVHLELSRSDLKRRYRSMILQEALFREVFEQIPIGIIVQRSKRADEPPKTLHINRMAEAILDRQAEDLPGLSWQQLTHEEDLPAELDQFGRFSRDEIDSYTIEKRILRTDGSCVWVNMTVTNLSVKTVHQPMYMCILEDISERKQSQAALRESERSKSVFLSHIPGMAYRCRHDRRWTMEYVSGGCYMLTGWEAANLMQNKAISYNDIIAPEYRQLIWDKWEQTIVQHKRYQDEYEIITKEGERKWVLEISQAVYDDAGHAEAIEGVIFDISDQKRQEDRVTYLKQHDSLTGLYNRRFIEEEVGRLNRPAFWPLSIIICDIDGLRMINSAYGYRQGDKMIVEVSGLIKSCARQGDVAGRISGGEFILLLPSTDSDAAQQIKADILQAVADYNSDNSNGLYAINLSIAHSTKESQEQSLNNVIRETEEYLQRRKLLNQSSSHSAIVSSIMATLYAKSQETEEHGQRLGKLSQMIGSQLGLKQQSLADLQLLSKLHDIGKIGIDDQILNKPGALTEKEWVKMKQHPEIGYRIAMMTPQLEHIADYILHHHERWDGTGYPRGLKGRNIPLMARILAVADAFDAMTQDRVYRTALTEEEALEEIRQGAGSQFDPHIADLFVQIMEGQQIAAQKSGL